ncbi:MAG: hypothetical protein LC753_01505 [Acidobacteria bacterium]|nr:hypothetical protein [Acidobacteriota bacterium]MCA1648983.1 hypothetical protein [Acidobacteriota bacterium]
MDVRESCYREWPDAAEIVGESAVKFTLHYQGDLPACTQSNTRSKEKHYLRGKFNPQLERLWKTEPLLEKIINQRQPFYAFRVTGGRIASPPDHDAMHEMVWLDGLENYWFVPLATRRNGLGCRLDIKWMRPGRPGSVINPNGGDLDNRLKTLFDALRIPHEAKEARGADDRAGKPSEHFYCLLEDDSLITDVCIATEPLLAPESTSPSESQLAIGVTLHVIAPNTMNRDYGE